jgi:Ni/Co efflux regulator RcnB
MKPNIPGSTLVLALALAGMLAMGQAIGKSDKGKDKHDKGGPKKVYFEDRHGVLVREYYTTQYSAGRCPPGLAKKNNGCMPPGQAKKWNVGQRLPANVTYYTVPASLTAQFGPPPVGYRYVRVGSDILLISISNRLIIDAIYI